MLTSTNALKLQEFNLKNFSTTKFKTYFRSSLMMLKIRMVNHSGQVPREHQLQLVSTLMILSMHYMLLLKLT